MRTLPDRDWQVIAMLFWCEMPISEVAHRLTVSETRIFQLRRRALGLLRAELGDRP